MQYTLFTLGALAGAVVADMGKAIVQNNCNYPVRLCNVPASGAGFQQVDMSLQSGKSYEQTWTKIGDVAGGWSIKLSKDENTLSHILQYEYTCKDDGVIWYDLSEVDGNPWSKDWEISANEGSGCDPKQAAYRFWNDDDHGMQSSCADSSVITVTLCSSSGSSNSSAPASSPAPAPAAPAPAAPAPAPVYSAPAAAPAYGSEALHFENKNKQQAPANAAPTTLATSVVDKSGVDQYVATVTDIVTHYATAYVTAEPRHERRHQHHGRHAHHA